MRSVSATEIRHLAPRVTRPAAPKPAAAIEPEPVKPAEPRVDEDLVAAAIKAFPDQLKDILRQLPAPVIAPRPPGAWVIDVDRDHDGFMKRMTAKFHETK